MTTEPPVVPAPTAPVAHAHTKKETLVEALKKGKDWAAVLILLLSFGQSVYAAYFKPEKDAHAAYETSKNGLENFSQSVNYSVAELKGRLDVIEKLCLERRSSPFSMKSFKSDSKVLVDADVAAVPDTDLVVELPATPWEQVK